MSLELATVHALRNPIQKRGRNSISRFGVLLTDGKWKAFWGHNSYKTHPLMRKFSGRDEVICTHAELNAIAQAVKYEAIHGNIVDLSDYTMYVSRVLKDGTPALAKPCEACQRAIIHFNVGDCKWTI